MRFELFKRVHGHNARHFGYAKIYPFFSEPFFWHRMATDIRAWLKCWSLCQSTKLGDREAHYTLVQKIVGARIAKCLVKFMARYRRIEKLHSNLGQKFKAYVSKHLFELWGMLNTYKTLYTPWSDGLVECANRTIQHLLKVYCDEHIHVWDEYIWCIMQKYNSTVQSSTGCTLSRLCH